MDVTPLLGGELFLCEGTSAIFLLEGPASAFASAGIATAAAAAARPCPVGPAPPAGIQGPLTAAQRTWAATVGGRVVQASKRGDGGGGARFRLDVADVMGPLAG